MTALGWVFFALAVGQAVLLAFVLRWLGETIEALRESCADHAHAEERRGYALDSWRNALDEWGEAQKVSLALLDHHRDHHPTCGKPVEVDQ